VVRREEVPFDEVLDSGAAVARISQATVRRYLARDASPVRIYHIVKQGEEKVVRLRPEWERFRKVLADRKLLDEQARNWRKDLLDGLPVVMEKRRSKKGQSSNEKNPEERTQN
jgi:DNA-binding PadR family transcriptional regulator